MRRLTRRRKEAIVMAYVLVTRGRIPTHLGALLAAMRERVPDLTEDELRRSVKWSLARSRRSGKLFERQLLAQRRDLAAAANVILLSDHLPPAPG